MPLGCFTLGTALKADNQISTASVNSKAQLISLFKKLTIGGSSPIPKPYGSEVTLRDGTTVTLRKGSKAGGATIDINYKKSLGNNEPFKIHINR